MTTYIQQSSTVFQNSNNIIVPKGMTIAKLAEQLGTSPSKALRALETSGQTDVFVRPADGSNCYLKEGASINLTSAKFALAQSRLAIASNLSDFTTQRREQITTYDTPRLQSSEPEPDQSFNVGDSVRIMSPMLSVEGKILSIEDDGTYLLQLYDADGFPSATYQQSTTDGMEKIVE